MKKIKKYPIVFAVVLTIILNVVHVSAACTSHQYTRSILSQVSRTCTSNGYTTYKYTCVYCGSSYTQQENVQVATGHNWSDWEYSDNGQHKKTCTNSWHNTSVDGAKYQYGSHSLNSKHQHNDYKWHQDCTVCNYNDIRWGWNNATVTFNYGDTTSSKTAAANSSITSPSGYTKAGKTLVGWNKNTSSVKTYNVQQNTGSIATWDWDTNSSKSVQEVAPSAQNMENAYSSASAVFEHNYIKVHYRANYNTGEGVGLTSDNYVDYVDYTQSLISRPMNQFSRTGYDIVTDGWFVSQTDDTAAYNFNKNLTATEWSEDVINNHTTDIYLYPKWTAHQLTIKYDKNINNEENIIGTQVMYYNDGLDDTSSNETTTYSLDTICPTRDGYVFMGWGISKDWCEDRYISSETQGIELAEDNTIASTDMRLAQDWATIGGKDLGTSSQTITLYAQWEKAISVNVSATNSAGENINAKVEKYNTDRKAELKEDLGKNINISNKTILEMFDISSDAFEGTASVVFDVKYLASEGDRITVLHYDENNSAWEDLGTYTVDANKTFTCEFTSFSPVILVTEASDEGSSTECEVYAEIGNSFTVTIPKKITLSGTTKTGSYTVTVEGDIAGTDIVKVVPDKSFALSSSGLADITATINQDKTEWIYSEFTTIGNGSINAKDLSAGKWEGSFNFNISLDGTKTNNSEENVIYKDLVF